MLNNPFTSQNRHIQALYSIAGNSQLQLKCKWALIVHLSPRHLLYTFEYWCNVHKTSVINVMLCFSMCWIFYETFKINLMLFLYIPIIFLCRYTKGNTGKPGASNIKPPDLWIHHDQMDLKNMEKSSQGSLEVPSSARDLEMDPTRHQPTNSLDKRTYTSSYIGMKLFIQIYIKFSWHFFLKSIFISQKRMIII